MKTDLSALKEAIDKERSEIEQMMIAKGVGLEKAFPLAFQFQSMYESIRKIEVILKEIQNNK